ncbi:hypothetical protein I79_000848 [Cricetulus griseus]|uniref:Uncharacterized protein n=1 Tax=Cricetulus griseus TaxID=10029 RepID=G3GT74_CRIGR|nr:hypothetical protein I79_000848 [Cricetulus griseus]
MIKPNQTKQLSPHIWRILLHAVLTGHQTVGCSGPTLSYHTVGRTKHPVSSQIHNYGSKAHRHQQKGEIWGHFTAVSSI